jgi:hypothetical protein
VKTIILVCKSRFDRSVMSFIAFKYYFRYLHCKIPRWRSIGNPRWPPQYQSIQLNSDIFVVVTVSMIMYVFITRLRGRTV